MESLGYTQAAFYVFLGFFALTVASNGGDAQSTPIALRTTC